MSNSAFTDNKNEMQLLGCIFLNNECYNDVRQMIPESEYFSNPVHRLIYDAIDTVDKSPDETIDAVSVAGVLEKKGILAQAGGIDLLLALNCEVATWRMYESYCSRIVKNYQLRCVYEAAQDASRIISTSDNADDARAEAVSRILQTGSITQSLKIVDLKDSLTSVVSQSQEAYKNPQETTGVPTGFKTLDWYTSGLQKGFVYIVGAGTGQGKSVFGLGLAVTAAKSGCKVLYVSLEMAPVDLSRRILASSSSVSSHKIRSGFLSVDEVDAMVSGARTLADIGSKMKLIDAPSLSVSQLRATAKALGGTSSIDLIVVDYLQLLRVKGGHSREREVAEISASLVEIARDCDVPIIALSQLNQDGAVRESRAVEHDASCVMRIDYEEEDWESDSNLVPCKLKVLKNRHGMLGTVNMVFDRPNQRFFEEVKDPW